VLLRIRKWPHGEVFEAQCIPGELVFVLVTFIPKAIRACQGADLHEDTHGLGGVKPLLGDLEDGDVPHHAVLAALLPDLIVQVGIYLACTHKRQSLQHSPPPPPSLPPATEGFVTFGAREADVTVVRKRLHCLCSLQKSPSSYGHCHSFSKTFCNRYTVYATKCKETPLD